MNTDTTLRRRMNFSYVAHTSMRGSKDHEWISGVLGLVDIFTYDSNGKIVDIETHSVIVLSEEPGSSIPVESRDGELDRANVMPGMSRPACTANTP